jgi:hypothetical protein
MSLRWLDIHFHGAPGGSGMSKRNGFGFDQFWLKGIERGHR